MRIHLTLESPAPLEHPEVQDDDADHSFLGDQPGVGHKPGQLAVLDRIVKQHQRLSWELAYGSESGPEQVRLTVTCRAAGAPAERPWKIQVVLPLPDDIRNPGREVT
jgi:hypothetical protein